MELIWLPNREDWDDTLRSLPSLTATKQSTTLRDLATTRLDFLATTKLDRAFQKAIAANGPLPGLEPLRLALLSSATISHLAAGIRVAGLRRGLAIEVYEAPYGMYWQELMDTGSGLHAFRPEAILLALDARHLATAEGATAASAIDLMQACWRQAKSTFACQVLQQTVMPVFPNLLGNNEARLPHSPASIVATLNAQLRPASETEGVDLLALDTFLLDDGLAAWHDPALWHRSKHEVHPRASTLYGDQVARLLAAARGRSSKCLVLDLDNTLWGGVIGDDGLEGIALGQGSGVGEAFADFQRYALALSDRGIILAVCSKNDEVNALAPFEQHPEMVLKRSHIACFVANWTDKATNLRHIARTLNIGLDSLVFADDNPVERALIRQELPLVAVPEMPEDPADYVRTVAAAGYFEGLRLTAEDRLRSEQYQANAERTRLLESTTDMGSYLDSLRMTLSAQPFDNLSLVRVTQLINKTNQFNLTTQRLTEAEVSERMNDARVVTLQARLTDRFGDNGIIAILIARIQRTEAGKEAVIETWLMSCRVLGRRVEEACLNLLAELCATHGATRLIGRYKASEKNSMVADLYPRLGFVSQEDHVWSLPLGTFTPIEVPLRVELLHPAAA